MSWPKTSVSNIASFPWFSFKSTMCLTCLLAKLHVKFAGLDSGKRWHTFMLAKPLLTLPQLQAQEWQADLEREWGQNLLRQVPSMTPPPLLSRTRTTPLHHYYYSTVPTGNFTLADTFLLCISNVSISLLKGLVSPESLARSLCAQGCRSLIKMLKKTHLSSNLHIMLAI